MSNDKRELLLSINAALPSEKDDSPESIVLPRELAVEIMTKVPAQKEKTRMLSSRVNTELYAEFKRLANSKGKTVKNLLPSLIKEFITTKTGDEINTTATSPAPFEQRSVRLPVDLYADVSRFAEKHQVTRRAIVEYVMYDYVVRNNDFIQVKLF